MEMVDSEGRRRTNGGTTMSDLREKHHERLGLNT
jgi:hypothetical protein